MDNRSREFKKTFTIKTDLSAPGSVEEKNLFNVIQQRFKAQYETIFPDKLAERTVVIIPSFTLDREILAKVKGIVHYEERMLCLLMLLRMPLTKIIYVTSIPVTNVIIDYYLHLLPGITGYHARKRLTMLSCYDASPKSLTQKILERPRLVQQIRQSILDPSTAHLTCFNITSLEKSLAVQLDIPLFGTDPDLFYEGSKSGGRKTFRLAGVDLPDGFEDLRTRADIVNALANLKRKYQFIRKAVLKMNDGFSGDGNAIYSYPRLSVDGEYENNIDATLSQQLQTVATDVTQD
ncbi:MAG: hypothetical protein ACRDE8_01760, partial [Ginsengibacter sp.]